MPGKKATTDQGSSNDKADQQKNQRIIVMGASTGGFEAFQQIIKALPADFNAAILIVWHISPDTNGILPQVLNKLNVLYASNARDNEQIVPGHIYIAPPDHHMLVEEGKLRITRGPKENRFRPAIDPLFRSAAYAYGNRVIAVILSGNLDDGTAGLWTVKQYGGIAIVQDPFDAEVPSMPRNAMRAVNVDHIVPITELPKLLNRLITEPLMHNSNVMKNEQTKKEIEIAAEENALKKNILDYGELSPFTCPECHGVLSRLQNDKVIRYRCHTGHAYSIDTLMAALTERIEDSLYNALRGIDESIMLLNNMGDYYAESNQPKLASLYFKKAKEAEERALYVRQAVLSHEQLSNDLLLQAVENENGGTAK